MVAGSCATWTIRFTVGPSGVDDGGRVRLCFPINSDWGAPQFTERGAPNFTTVRSTGGARLTARYDPRGAVRPWSKALTVLVDDGYLREADEVVIVLGDTTGGSPGFEAQPYCEAAARFCLFVDTGGTGAYLPVPMEGSIALVGGEPAALDLVIPADLVAGEPFRVGATVRDEWGNPATGKHEVSVSGIGADGGPQVVSVGENGLGSGSIEAIAPAAGDILRLQGTVAGTDIGATSNPARVHGTAPSQWSWWGDLHGQSAETCGTGPADEYIAFARDSAFLDFVGHQGNDFELTDANWASVKSILNAANVTGRFVSFIGYEWSGNTGAGGDHNVMFSGDDAPLLRSGLWLLDESEASDPVCPTIDALKAELAGRDDAMLIPHVGGRYADPATIDDTFSPLVEIWSTHGEFPWIFEDAIARGQRVGISCGSDDHTGRLGATWPGRRAFAVRGGLLCLTAPALSRADLWAAIKEQRTVGTTGERILLEVDVDGASIGDTVTHRPGLAFAVRAHGTRPIERITLQRGLGEIVASHKSANARAGTIRVSWQGARNRGRERAADWSGMLTVSGPQLVGAVPFAFDRRLEGIEQDGQTVRWTSTTAGDTDGVTLTLDRLDAGTLTVLTPYVTATIDLADIAKAPGAYDAGGEGLRLTVEALPEPLGLDVECALAVPAQVDRLTPFCVTVHQVDGNKAWSSPIWVEPA